MAFPTAARPALAPTAPAAPAPPAPPMGAPAPPAPPTPPAAARNFWCAINGATVAKTEAEARALPPATPAMLQGQEASGWSTLAALLGAAPAGAAAPAPAVGSRSAFGQRPAPAQAQAPQQPQGVPRGMFAGVENADVIRRGNNINAGDYICKVCSSEFKAGRQKNFVITELEVVKSSYAEADPATHGCNREGSRMTNFVSQNDNFASNIKEIILAVSGFDPATGKHRDAEDVVSQAECEALVSPEQPYAGAMVYIEAREVPTKTGGLFTRVSWWPCPLNADGSPDEVKLFTVVR